MTALSQTELMVDCESAVKAAASLPLSSSSSSSRQQQQQLGTEDDNHGVSGCVKPYDDAPVTDPGADVPVVGLPVVVIAAAAGGEDDGDVSGDECDVDGRVKSVKICTRCEKEFRSKTRYVKHCKKCCDD